MGLLSALLYYYKLVILAFWFWNQKCIFKSEYVCVLGILLGFQKCPTKKLILFHYYETLHISVTIIIRLPHIQNEYTYF